MDPTVGEAMSVEGQDAANAISSPPVDVAPTATQVNPSEATSDAQSPKKASPKRKAKLTPEERKARDEEMEKRKLAKQEKEAQKEKIKLEREQKKQEKEAKEVADKLERQAKLEKARADKAEKEAAEKEAKEAREAARLAKQEKTRLEKEAKDAARLEKLEKSKQEKEAKERLVKAKEEAKEKEKAKQVKLDSLFFTKPKPAPKQEETATQESSTTQPNKTEEENNKFLQLINSQSYEGNVHLEYVERMKPVPYIAVEENFVLGKLIPRLLFDVQFYLNKHKLGRTPLAKVEDIDYDDSEEAEWECEDAEDIQAEGEDVTTDSEASQFEEKDEYDLDEEGVVPDEYLSDGEGIKSDSDDSNSEDEDPLLQKPNLSTKSGEKSKDKEKNMNALREKTIANLKKKDSKVLTPKSYDFRNFPEIATNDLMSNAISIYNACAMMPIVKLSSFEPGKNEKSQLNPSSPSSKKKRARVDVGEKENQRAKEKEKKEKKRKSPKKESEREDDSKRKREKKEKKDKKGEKTDRTEKSKEKEKKKSKKKRQKVDHAVDCANNTAISIDHSTMTEEQKGTNNEESLDMKT